MLAVLRGPQARIVVAVERDLRRWMKQAIVAIEDKRFYEHRGVDVHGIVRARLAGRPPQAGRPGRLDDHAAVRQERATPTSQRSIGRKLKEAALAWQLEQRWSKDRILTAYLNTIYFGNGAYGVEQAARIYFRHGADDARRSAEAALLAGIPRTRASTTRSPTRRRARERRNLVLQPMLDQGDITYAEYANASTAPLPKPGGRPPPRRRSGPAPYFANYVKQQLVDRYGAGRVFGGGLTRADDDRPRTCSSSRGRRSRSGCRPERARRPRSSRSTRATARVLAMVGGSNYHKSQFNLAVAGRAPAGLVVQAVRARDRARRTGSRPSTTFDVEAR